MKIRRIFPTSIAVLLVVYYFAGLLTYHQSYASFIYNRQSGVPFELMSSFNFGQNNSWQVSWFFGQHGVDFKEITLYGAGFLLCVLISREEDHL